MIVNKSIVRFYWKYAFCVMMYDKENGRLHQCLYSALKTKLLNQFPQSQEKRSKLDHYSAYNGYILF